MFYDLQYLYPIPIFQFAQSQSVAALSVHGDLSLELSLLSLQGSLSSPGSPQVLRCQLSLFEVYFSSWDAEGQRTFVRLLAQKDPSFVRRFLISLEQREPLLAATLAPL